MDLGTGWAIAAVITSGFIALWQTMRGEQRNAAAWSCFMVSFFPLVVMDLVWAPTVNDMTSRIVISGIIGATTGAFLLIGAAELFYGRSHGRGSPAQSPLPSSTTFPPSAQQSNQGPGQLYNAPGGNIYINPPAPQPPAESGAIQQAGIVVGKAFGARRSPSDATKFEFVEITNCAQFNTNEPFTYNDIRMRFVSERTSAYMIMGRPDSPIRFGVIARILE
jgi:hypothetical protein